MSPYNSAQRHALGKAFPITVDFVRQVRTKPLARVRRGKRREGDVVGDAAPFQTRNMIIIAFSLNKARHTPAAGHSRAGTCCRRPCRSDIVRSTNAYEHFRRNRLGVGNAAHNSAERSSSGRNSCVDNSLAGNISVRSIPTRSIPAHRADNIGAAPGGPR